ncbi:MAG: bifunctional phosphoserine phosphatase/homoserine phosphotransferase ThrH [Sphaerochaetaceae bacterium]|nr:bifunctional phosphoserine phosphatase/homoserine phosphotransferase ThrH [Sphaerochaetaceae bacterium]MDC7247892.1 bifunctional phosphoserine phosphatase/homoserine phosphotransferase ThrH [Sphaerochaetaceae bacterium]
MKVVCLDLEGVLVPEIWISVAQKTKIAELRRTTRDESNYDVLMNQRLAILKEHGLTLSDIQEVIRTLDPLDGALSFLQTLREKTQVIILSDTFSEFAHPLMEKLMFPTIFCNSLVIDENDMIVDYKLRQQDGKRKAVQALQQIGFTVFAAGDSYNDLTMIKNADSGALFRAPESILEEEPNLPLATTYEEFLSIIDTFL